MEGQSIRRKRAKRDVSTKEFAGMISRTSKAMALRLADEDSTQASYIRQMEDAIDHVWRVAVDGWRAAGESDGQIGAALGISSQAVNKRWPRRTPGAPGNEYSNGRV
jgi:hypothetical protein